MEKLIESVLDHYANMKDSRVGRFLDSESDKYKPFDDV